MSSPKKVTKNVPVFAFAGGASLGIGISMLFDDWAIGAFVGAGAALLMMSLALAIVGSQE